MRSYTTSGEIRELLSETPLNGKDTNVIDKFLQCNLTIWLALEATPLMPNWSMKLYQMTLMPKSIVIQTLMLRARLNLRKALLLQF